MKKIYLIFALFLMVMGINTVSAKVVLGSQITDPNAISGKKIVLRANSPLDANADELKYKFLTSLKDSMLWAKTTVEAVDPYVSMTAESAGKQVCGKDAYYLKNEKNGKYIKYVFEAATDESDGSVYEDDYGNMVIEMMARYTDKKDEATPFAVCTIEEGTALGGYKGEEIAENEGTLMFITECKEYDNKKVALNYAFDRPYVASYFDWASWWHVTEATIEENYVDDLRNLFETVTDINFFSGSEPGCYNKDLVDAYNTAKKEAETLLNSSTGVDDAACKSAYLKLEDAYLNLQVAHANPVVTGYYRFVSANPAFTSKQQESKGKAFYGINNNVDWGELDTESANQVWQVIDRKDGSWLMYNIGTGKYINGTNGSQFGAGWVSLSKDSTNNKITFEGLGQSQFNIRIKGSNAFHAGGHNNGEGVSGSLVVYNGGINTPSAWMFKGLTADEIEKFSKIGEQNALNSKLQDLFNTASAKYDIGSSYQVETDSTKWLVTLADYNNNSKVVLSNATHSDWHEGTADAEGVLKNLLDTANATIWGSCWSTPAPKEQHYLQFALNKPVKEFALLLDRRGNQPNQATQLDVFACNEDTAKAENWIKVGVISGLPESTVGTKDREKLLLQTKGVTMDKEYKYLRFYLTSNSKLINGQRFTHFAGFHIQPATLDPSCQNAKLGETAKNLKAALDEANQLLSKNAATQEAITKLQNAYDAYIAVLADPTVLKNKVDSISGVYAKAATPSMTVKDGEDAVYFNGEVGVYTDEAKTALNTAIEHTKKFIADNEKAGTFSKENLAEETKKLEDAFAAFKASQGKLKAADENGDGVWYCIAASKRYYDVTGKTQDVSGEDKRNGQIYVEVGENGVLNNAYLRYADDKTSDDYALWRFINLGDTAYAIQNKGTGLYIGEKTSGNAGLSMTPVAFKIKEIGYATFILDGFRYDGTKTSPLHAQTVGQTVVFWNDYNLGSGSCWDIYTPGHGEGDNASDVTTDDFVASKVVKGQLYTMCYPIDLDYVLDAANQEAQAYGISKIDMEGKKLHLKAIIEDKIEAGTPFFYIAGGKDLGVNEAPTAADTIDFSACITENSKVIAATPKTVNGLVGNYYGGTRLVKGMGIIKNQDNKPVIGSSAKNQSLGWNSAYVNAGMITDNGDGEITVPLAGNLSTSIEDAINDAITGNVNVYTIDGILVKKNVKASEATNGLVKGIYIVGNKKVAVQ